jgi:hypothetical protein
MRTRRLKFGHTAVIFGVCGIALLYVVTVLSHPLTVSNFDDIDQYEGQTVSVEGAVINHYITNQGELVYTLYNNNDLLNIIVESSLNDLQIAGINSILQVTGDVQKNYRGEYEIIVTDNKNMQVIGHYEPVKLNWTKFENYNNTYVQTHGTIISLEDYYGNKQKLTLKNCSDKIDAVISDTSVDIDIGAQIEINGIISRSRETYRLYVYNSKTIVVTGHWKLDSIGMAELSDEPEKYTEFPVRIKGFVRYEPSTIPAYSFYLSDLATDPSISIRVDLYEFPGDVIVHKGDTVALVGYTAFDRAMLRYYLIPITLNVTSSYGEWQLSIEELVESPYEYEGALLNLSGYLHCVEDNFYLCNRAIYENCSITLPIEKLENQTCINNSIGSKIVLKGSLIYDDTCFTYLFTLKPNPDCVFWFPHFG